MSYGGISDCEGTSRQRWKGYEVYRTTTKSKRRHVDR